MAPKWSVNGTYFEACNCEVSCPCVMLSAPTSGDCKLLVAWHIDKGKFGGVKLDGLNVAMAVHSPGHMAKVKWKAALYLDEGASQAQEDALTKIFGGKAGGHPAVVATLIGEVLGVKSVPIKYKAVGKRRSVVIPSIAEAAIEAIEGQGGAQVTISNHPVTVAPGEPAVVAKSHTVSYHDHGFD